MKCRRYLAAVGVALACTTAGCGESSETGAAQADAPEASVMEQDSEQPTSSATASTTIDEADAVVIEVSIANGSVTPTNERIDAVVGEPVTVRVDSDVTDELHVHSVPDHTFDVQAQRGQSFEFVVTCRGR